MDGTIEMTGVGAVERLSMDVSEPGLYVLRAANGAGKSTALRAIQTLISGTGRIPVADGCDQAEVSGLGIRMVAGRNQKRFGELEFELDDSGMSLATAIDPGIKDPVAADRERIKALVQIAGIKPSPNMFLPLFGNEQDFKEVVQVSSMQATDLVEMAAKIKRDVDAAALNKEREFTTKSQKLEGLKGLIPADSVESNDDPEQLKADLKQAQEYAATIRNNQKQAIAIHEKHRKDSTELASVSIIDVNEIVTRGKRLAEQIEESDAEISMAREELAKAQARLDSAVMSNQVFVKQKEACAKEYESAKLHNKRVADLQATQAAALPAIPNDAEIEIYDRAVTDILQRIDRVQNTAKINDLREQAEKLLFESEEAKLQGERLRGIAKKVDSVLSKVISEDEGGLRVRSDGRLVLDTDRGEELFSDLSKGEAYRKGIEFMVKSLTRRFPDRVPIAVLNQEAYEGLQPAVKAELPELCREYGIALATAEAADNEEIEVEVM